MSAIITNILKKNLLQHLINEVAGDSDNYYIGIGKSEQWNDSDVADTVNAHLYDEINFRLSMQSIKSAEDVSFVVPRNNWISGTIYSAYDNKVAKYPTAPYYVITGENNVYVCIERGRNADGTTKASIVQPSGTSTSLLKTSDGYTWQYLYTVNTARAVKWLSANFMPVQLVDSDDAVASANDALQKAVQDAAVPGEILNINISAAGSGYTSAPTVMITGNGTGAAATATVSGGVVKRISMDSDSRGSGYTYAQVALTGGSGSGAVAYASLGPLSGIGADPVDDLRSTAVMFNTKPAGGENDDFILDNDFRQIAVIKNPLGYADSSYASATGLGLRKIIGTSTVDVATFTTDQTITGTTSGSQAIIDYIDSDEIWYHQTLTTGFGSFDSDVGSTITAPGASATVGSTINTADIDHMTGEILYLENRAAITRDADQTEDIKVIIQL
jgi:hypothetical protein